MKRFKKILAPTDFSDHSDAGLRYADYLAKTFGSEVLVFHVLPHQEVEKKEALPPPSGYVDEISKETELTAADHYRKAALPGPAGSRPKTAAASGVPFVEIIHKEREEGCDLIVMSTHGRTGLNHMLVGSVAETVVRLARKPVWTVRKKAFAFERP
ncbi:MAG: universal stress protein [Nitrospinota bacterium]|nr:universal stress protein [Nitrospinota bacterium]HJM42181.1 universal stress protein [Nitrospinota bacterium]